jgi:O-antigen/teichoic acid export membrane protein
MISQPIPPSVEAARTTDQSDDKHGRHFRTDHLMADLKGRSVRGGAVTMAAQGAKFVLQLGSTAVLARLLTPADFGLVAMVTAVTGFVAMFKDAGLSMATVQREHITHEQVSTLFWINVALSAALMLVTAALSPAIAWFYGEPRLTAITLALAATFVFGGLTVQHQALLQRQMRFTALSGIAVATLAASVAAAIGAAWYGLGYWALVIMGATGAAVNAALVWMFSGWRPGPPVRGSGVMPMLKFGGNLTGFNFVNYFARNADNVLIGWWWGAGALGMYSKAYGLLMMPLRQINAPIIAAATPALSRLNNDRERYRRAFARMLQTICMVTLPIVGMLVVSSDLVITLVLGDEWSAAAPIFAWLGIAAFIQPVNNSLGILLITQGRTSDYFWAGTVNAIFTVAIFLLTVPYGVKTMAIGYAAFSLLATPALWFWCGRSGHVTALDIAKSARLPLVMSILCAMCVVGLRSVLAEYGVAGQLLATLLGPLLIGCLLLCLPSGRQVCLEMVEQIILPLYGRLQIGRFTLKSPRGEDMR